jgi:DNA-damage-inducible protein D
MSDIEVFEPFDESIRKVWNAATQEWWLAVVDVVQILTESADASAYWRQMKRRDKELVTICHKFPLKSLKNNRTYQTDCANQEGMLRIIQSISSPKAEPFKQWLAKTGSRRLDEIRNDPIELEREKYRLQGYDEEWINARLSSKAVRNELTDEWNKRQISGRQYGELTNEIHKGTFDGLSVQAHKEHKGVEKGNLRDHMTRIELAFTILGEATTTEIAQKEDAQGYGDNLIAAQKGGNSAGAARRAFEEFRGEKVISDKSYLNERKRLLAHGSVGACESCHNPVNKSQTYGTEAGSLCQDCFDKAIASGEINQDGEVL